jgi:hypothetical protein
MAVKKAEEEAAAIAAVRGQPARARRPPLAKRNFAAGKLSAADEQALKDSGLCYYHFAYADGAIFQMPTIANWDGVLHAQWTSVPVYALNVSSSNPSYGTVSVTEGTGPFAAGTTIHLTATPLANYAFVNWEGYSGVAGARSAVTTLTMPSAAVTITANFSVPSTGALSSTDRRSYGRGANFYADIYSFTISTAQTVTISMVAPNQDSYLFLYKDTWGGTLKAYNDDSGGTLDSMIGPISLVPGTYFVDATSYQPNTPFSYTLTASSTSGAIALTQY